MKIFLSTPSARRATLPSCWKITRRQNFYPRPPRGGRHQQGLEKMWSRKFLSTPSARRATRTGIRLPRSMGNFYPRPPRGGRPDTNDSRLGPEHFYPRPPRGGRHKHLERRLRASKFLSTPSARRATVVPCCLRTLLPNFYPRPPRGGRPNGLVAFANGYIFLSTPSAKRATRCLSCHLFNFTFLSTPSARRATSSAPGSSSSTMISIHALREEGDAGTTISAAKGTYFYPRPPRGGRPGAATPSRTPCSISIHALREEGDLNPPTQEKRPTNFYPRPPRGGRRYWVFEGRTDPKFLSTPSARRATICRMMRSRTLWISIHALREEGDTWI